jgi:hypothetical protein
MKKNAFFQNFPKLLLGIDPAFFLMGLLSLVRLAFMSKASHLIIIGRHTKSVLKMEFFFFLDEKLKNIVKEKQACEGKKLFDILNRVGS